MELITRLPVLAGARPNFRKVAPPRVAFEKDPALETILFHTCQQLAGTTNDSTLRIWLQIRDFPKSGSIPPLWAGHAGSRSHAAIQCFYASHRLTERTSGKASSAFQGSEAAIKLGARSNLQTIAARG